MSNTTFRLMEVLRDMKDIVGNLTDTIFTNGRPKSVAETMEDFIVVSIPVMLYNKTIGGDYGLVSSYVRFEIYVRDIDGIENTPKITRMSEALLNNFPFTKNGVVIKEPRVALKGSDQHDFHVALIQATLVVS